MGTDRAAETTEAQVRGVCLHECAFTSVPLLYEIDPIIEVHKFDILHMWKYIRKHFNIF